MKHLPLLITFLFSCILVSAQKTKSFDVSSPNGNVKLHIDVVDKLQWSIQHKGQQVIEPSAISNAISKRSIGRQFCCYLFQNRQSKYNHQCNKLYKSKHS